MVNLVYRNALEKGEGLVIEHRLICEDGSIKYLLCIGEAIKDDNALAGIERKRCRISRNAN